MTKPLIPPHYVNVPTDMLFNCDLSEAIKDTYYKMRAFAWGKDETPILAWKDVLEAVGKKRSTIYQHLGVLRDTNWLLFSSTQHSCIQVRFLDRTVMAGDLSRSLDALNQEEVNTDLNTSGNNLEINKPPPPDNQGAGSTSKFVQKSGQTLQFVQKSGQDVRGKLSESLDKSGKHFSEDLKKYLTEKVGLYPGPLQDAEATFRSGDWTEEHIWKLGKVCIALKANSLGFEGAVGKAGGIFIHRLKANMKPDLLEDDPHRYLKGKYGQFVER